ncbi:hypothetical protein JB92DRAFT_2912892 [Gautieria morchelliformis]|nr:hypothetical protein JB92DRAFT_3079224 [Gautieria morchelliformis]KAF8473771.1 hypothetical protein JB92DRAFT_3053073 [Gautieria morchelliformis]KAF8499405.1 hypothetical protein JB92DRAFT_2981643 [Gautieria morchelliformis]KAF8512439.1 hypothetical protein JB92DRAFT_2928833 [Gautieria morchelliformis]KAF8515862.1 hypothetical protein JB92DRAFT_2912892 [Gautieria morchelliformis]
MLLWQRPGCMWFAFIGFWPCNIARGRRTPFLQSGSCHTPLLFDSPRYFPEFFLFEACGTHSDGLRSTFDLSNVSTELNELGISSSLTHLLGSGCQARRKYMDEETGRMLGD